VKRFLKWCLSHKWIAVLSLVGLVLIAEFLTLPSFREIDRLSSVNPQITALMKERAGEAAAKRKPYAIHCEWVPLSRISDDLQHAIIVGEDGTFFEHEGVDWYEMKEAIKKDIARGKIVRGGSTITQQLAKNLFLSTSRGPSRKIKELFITWRMESELSKERILEIYLNCIEWGDGIFGAEAASETYFRKHASDLSRDEAARLAAVIPSPLKHHPDRDDRFLTYRKDVILGRMEGRGW